jgi:hypothetical protein
MLATRTSHLFAASKAATTSQLAARAFSVSAASLHAAPAPVPPKQKLKEFKIYRWVRTESLFSLALLTLPLVEPRPAL